MKSFIKKLIPPIFISFYRYLNSFIKRKFLPKKQHLDVYYDEQMAEDLDKWGEKNVWIEIQHLLYEKDSKILDIACGTGKVIEILLKKTNNDIYGCDISKLLLEKCISRGINKEKLMECDATKLPYSDNYFDYCYSIGSLEHFTEEGIDKFLESSKRVTKYTGFHMIPVSKSNKDEGWLTFQQSYFNNSINWWEKKLNKHFKKILILESSWESEISKGVWLIISK